MENEINQTVDNKESKSTIPLENKQQDFKIKTVIMMLLLSLLAPFTIIGWILVKLSSVSFEDDNWKNSISYIGVLVGLIFSFLVVKGLLFKSLLPAIPLWTNISICVVVGLISFIGFARGSIFAKDAISLKHILKQQIEIGEIFSYIVVALIGIGLFYGYRLIFH